MVERGPHSRPQASEGEAQHGPFCRTRRISQGNKYLHRGRHRQDRAGSEGCERTGSIAVGADKPRLPLQADRTESRAAVQAVYEPMKLLRDATNPAQIKNIASSTLIK